MLGVKSQSEYIPDNGVESDFNMNSIKIEELHDPVLCKPREHLVPEVRSWFPAYEHGIYFHDRSIVVESVSYPDPAKGGLMEVYLDALEIIFPNEFTILRSGCDHIVYGILGEIEITYSHPKTGFLKADFCIMNDRWLNFEFKYRVEKHTRMYTQPGTKKAGSSLRHPNGTLREIPKKIRLIRPPESFVRCDVDKDTIRYDIKKRSREYPIVFDPCIMIEAMNTNAYTTTGCFGLQCVRLTKANGGRIYVGYMTSTTQYRAAYSDDMGMTWTAENIAATPTVGYRDLTLCTDANDQVWAVFGTQNGAGNWGLGYSVKPYGGAWAALAQIQNNGGGGSHMMPDIQVGPNGVPQVSWWFWTANRYVYYTNSAHYAWPGTDGTQALLVSDVALQTGRSPLVVDKDTNDCYICYADNGAKNLSYKAYDYSVPSLSARTDLYVGTTNYDIRPYSVICWTEQPGSTMPFYIAYTNARTYPGGYNICITGQYTSPIIPSYGTYNITNSTTLQYWYCHISMDSSGYLWCLWMGNGVASWSLYSVMDLGAKGGSGAGTTFAPSCLYFTLAANMEMPCPPRSYQWLNQLPHDNFGFYYTDIGNARAMWMDLTKSNVGFHRHSSLSYKTRSRSG